VKGVQQDVMKKEEEGEEGRVKKKRISTITTTYGG